MGPWPITSTVSSGLQVEQFYGLVAGVDRLDPCGLLEWNIVGQLDQAAAHDPVHHADVLGKAAAGLGSPKPAVAPTFL